MLLFAFAWEMLRGRFAEKGRKWTVMGESGPSMGVGLGAGVFSVDLSIYIQLWGKQDHQRDGGWWVVARQQSGCWGMLASANGNMFRTTQAGGISLLHQFDCFVQIIYCLTPRSKYRPVISPSSSGFCWDSLYFLISFILTVFYFWEYLYSQRLSRNSLKKILFSFLSAFPSTDFAVPHFTTSAFFLFSYFAYHISISALVFWFFVLIPTINVVSKNHEFGVLTLL